MTKTIIGRQPIPARLRDSVLERDNWTCVYCGFKPKQLAWFDNTNWRALEALHMDHVVPVSRGGINAYTNLVTACAICNLAKHTKLWKPPIAECYGCGKLFRNPPDGECFEGREGYSFACPDCQAVWNKEERLTDDLWEETGDFDDIALEVASWDMVIEAAGF